MNKDIEAAVVASHDSEIGQAIVTVLLGHGLTVFALQRRAPTSTHRNLHFRRLDPSDISAAERIAEEIATQYSVRYLIHCIGENHAGRRSATIEDFGSSMTIAALVLTRTFLPPMRIAKFGRIVSVVSQPPLEAPSFATFANAGAALVGMTRSIAAEAAKDGVTANSIVVGPLASDDRACDSILPASVDPVDALSEEVFSRSRRAAENAARTTMFFLDTEAGYITGQELAICGGRTLIGTENLLLD